MSPLSISVSLLSLYPALDPRVTEACVTSGRGQGPPHSWQGKCRGSASLWSQVCLPALAPRRFGCFASVASKNGHGLFCSRAAGRNRAPLSGTLSVVCLRLEGARYAFPTGSPCAAIFSCGDFFERVSCEVFLQLLEIRTEWCSECVLPTLLCSTHHMSPLTHLQVLVEYCRIYVS